MGVILDAAKLIGKEFLENKAADIVGGAGKAIPTGTAQSDIPVDLSETTSMEDTYEPTVSDADENDPGMADINYDIGQSFLPEYDFSAYVRHRDDENDTYSDSDIESEPKDDTETNIIDELNNRLESSDTGIAKDKDWGSAYKDDPGFKDMVFSKAQDGDYTAKRYMSALDRAKGGSFNDREKLKSWEKRLFKNIENNPDWKEYWDKSMASGEASGEAPTYDQLFGNRISDIKDLPITDEEYRKLSAAELEQITEEYPEKIQEDLPNTPIAEEAHQITDDDDKRNDEVNNEAAEETVEILNSEPLVSGYRREDDKLLDEYGNEIPDYEPIDTEGGVLTRRDEDFLGQDEWIDEEGNIHDYSELANGNTEALNKKWYEGDESGEGEYSESGNVNLDYEAAELQDQIKETVELQDQIKEAEALPVTNAEEAKEKQNKLRALRLRLKEVRTATGHGSNVQSADPTTDNGIQTTGGRASPRAGIGNIGGGAAGHGSMASTRPIKMASDNHNSIASKAPLPHALEDNQGRVVSVNGKATTAPSSNNNGAFRSGSFGLMSKAKSSLKSIPSKAPVSGGPEHMGSSMAGAGKGTSGDFNLEDGKQILIERLKQLLTQLTDEEKKELGFSPALNQWNGKALIRLDGYTLQGLIDKVEEQLGKRGNK